MSPEPSASWLTRRITRGLSAHSAPRGADGSVTSNVGYGSGTSIENASIVPSGDHTNPLGDRSSWVSRAICPVSCQRT